MLPSGLPSLPTMRSKALAKAEPVDALGVTSPPDIQIRCEAFTGSLGALFQMARDGKIDLLGVPLAPICRAYIEYVTESAGGDLDRAAVALVALSYLLERKAWHLLPSEVPEPETDESLYPVEPWIQEFAPAIEALRELADSRDQVFFRAPEGTAYELPFDASGVSLGDLAGALQRLLDRAVPEPPEGLRKPGRSLSEQMGLVMRELTAEFRTLDRIVVGEFTRSEIVWWFLALLELIRLGQAKVRLRAGEVEFAGGAAA